MIRLEGMAVDIRSTLTELCEAFNAHDLDRIMAFFSDDCVLEMPRGSEPWGSRFEGKRSVREALATRFEGLPDVHYGNEEHFVDSAADTGMSNGPLPAPPATGRERKSEVATSTRFATAR
jgi:ketosteroid isomerase-like protein